MKTTIKIQMMMLAAITIALLLATTGCGNKEEAATSQPVPTRAPRDASPDTIPKAVQGQTEVVKEKAEEAAGDVQAKADAAAAKANDATGKVQNLIEQARKLVGENKWTEALGTLNTLAGQSLTPDQQKLVAQLKEQIQKALASKTANDAVGNLLKK